MKHRVEWRPRAQKDLNRLSPEMQQRVFAAIKRLAEGEGQIRRLEGIQPPLFRMRVGDCRILFTYDDLGTAEIQRILPRDKAYKG
jgi:mRNA-degrading endonuclease RelE of RelBE toxin-antitoxin system